MFSNKPIEKRKLIYDKFKYTDLLSKHNLIFYTKNKFQKEINTLVNLYIQENIKLVFKQKYAGLEKSINDILNLPNITPGGILHPRRETQLTYNLITQYLMKSLDNYIDLIEGMAFPVIRIKSGYKKDIKRPYETSKLHSDSWVGQYGDSIISYGIEGDFKNNGVNFYLPENVTKDFFKKINNYDEGLKKFSKIKYLGKLKIGYFFIFDHSILHKTVIKYNSKPRISIDLGIKIKNTVSRNIINGDKKRWNYFNPSIFKMIGTKYLIENNQSIFQKKINIKQINQLIRKITK